MLAHSPPLPLIIDYFDENNDIDAKDEEGLIYAFQQRDRVRRIRFMQPVPILERLIIHLDGEFPILEHLLIKHQPYLRPSTWCNRNLNLPETFLAPNLRHLILMSFAIPIGSPLFTMGNLVSLSLTSIPASVYFHPNALLQRLSLMPQLETVGVFFDTHFFSGDIQRQLLRTPIAMRATLPSLRWFGFQGASAYLEALLPQMTIPLLEKLQVSFFNQLTYPIPNLQQLMSAAGNLRLNTAALTFQLNCLVMHVYPHKGESMYTLQMVLGGKHLDWQVACAAQVFHMLRARFSVLEHLTLQYRRHSMSSEWNNKADRTQWRELLMSFDNLKTLHVDRVLVGQLSRSLQPSNGQSPTELLPELQELSYSGRRPLRDAFTPFVYARRKAGRPMAVIRR
jgi:hypothetical protein